MVVLSGLVQLVGLPGTFEYVRPAEEAVDVEAVNAGKAVTLATNWTMGERK